MPTLIDDKRTQIEALCRRYRVRRLDVFGSAIREDFDPSRSDVDFLVEFEADPDLNTFHAYMDLREALGGSPRPACGPRHALGRPEPLHHGGHRGDARACLCGVMPVRTWPMSWRRPN